MAWVIHITGLYNADENRPRTDTSPANCTCLDQHNACEESTRYPTLADH